MSVIARFEIQPADGGSFTWAMREPRAIVGRSQKADLVINDRGMSRRHVRFFVFQDALMVRDLGSRNGTEVNGRLIDGEQALLIGDRLNLGSSSLEVLDLATGLDFHSGFKLGANTVWRDVVDLLAAKEAPILPELEEARTRIARLEMLAEIHEILTADLAREQLLELILDRTFDELKPQQAAIILNTGENSFEIAAQRVAPGWPRSLLFSSSLYEQVAIGRRAAMANDVAADQRFAGSESLKISGLTSLIAAPLTVGNESLGMIASARRGMGFHEGDLRMLVALASATASKLRNLELTKVATQRQAMEKELTIARRIQLALLPDALPQPEGWQLWGRSRPARVVCGDLYGASMISGGQLAVWIADAAGKGIAAALVTSTLEALLTGHLEHLDDPAEICRRLSEQLLERTPPERYSTLFLALIEPDSGRMRSVSAGHTPTYLLRMNGELRTFPASGPPPGLDTSPSYEVVEEQFDPGDLLAMFTDGFSEAENSAGEELGLDGIEAMLRRLCGEHPRLAALGKALDAEALAFIGDRAPEDDQTMLLLGRGYDAP